MRHLQARIGGSLEFNAAVLDGSRIAACAHFEAHAAAIHFAFLDWGACIVSAKEAAARPLHGAFKLGPVLSQNIERAVVASESCKLLAPPAPGIGLHRPVMPAPVGTSRSQTATCGRSVAGFAAMVTLAVASPGDVASTVMLPGSFVGLDKRHAKAGKGLARCALIGFLIGGVSVAGADQFPLPRRRVNVTSLSVMGTTRPCAS